MAGKGRSMFAEYACPCAPQRSFVRRGPADIAVCRRCRKPIAGAIRIGSVLSRDLREATWRGSVDKSKLIAEHINNMTSVEARPVSTTSALGKAIQRALGTGRNWAFQHRNVGHIVGRPGLASSNLKSRGALRRALSKLRAGDGKLGLQIVPNGRDPRVLGKLVEAEFATRVDHRVSANLLAMRKVRGCILHPILKAEVSVSADGTFVESRPVEAKTIEADLSERKLLARIDAILHQVAQQAILMDAAEALVVFIERSFDGSGRWFAVLIEDGLKEFHGNAVASWLQRRSHDIGNTRQEEVAR